MKAKEVMNILNITRVTLSSYVKSNKIKVYNLPNGRYLYDDDSVLSLIGRKSRKTNKKIISYSRVSTNNQKEQLKAQTIRIYESCVSRGIVLDEQIEDVKSGMDSNRLGFQKLCNEIIQGNVQLLIIENKDRLVRFGFDILESIFKKLGTSILILNEVLENKSYEKELTEDLISIIHYFTMKSYSHRKILNKLRKELESKP